MKKKKKNNEGTNSTQTQAHTRRSKLIIIETQTTFVHNVNAKTGMCETQARHTPQIQAAHMFAQQRSRFA